SLSVSVPISSYHFSIPLSPTPCLDVSQSSLSSHLQYPPLSVFLSPPFPTLMFLNLFSLYHSFQWPISSSHPLPLPLPLPLSLFLSLSLSLSLFLSPPQMLTYH